MVNQNYELITFTIPNKFNFADGREYNNITDGGLDMYIIILINKI